MIIVGDTAPLPLLGEHEGPPNLLLLGSYPDLFPCLRGGLHLCDNLLISVSTVKRTHTLWILVERYKAYPGLGSRLIVHPGDSVSSASHLRL